MSTKISLLYFDLSDGSDLHIYQEAGTDEVWMERRSLLCTVAEWKAARAKQREPRTDERDGWD